MRKCPKPWTLVGLCVAALACSKSSERSSDGGPDGNDAGEVGDAGDNPDSPAQAERVCDPAIEHLRTCGVLGAGELECGEEDIDDQILCNLSCLIAASCADLETFACTEGDGPFAGPLGSCLKGCDPAFTCRNGDEIDLDWTCDGTPDCVDSSDEADCDEFACADGTPATTGARCNGVLECADESDERDCPGYTCADGTRVSVEGAECDGWEDCIDSSDEVDCPTFDCGTGEQIELDRQCDGDADCSNSNDERNCPEQAELLCNGVPID